MEPLLNPTLGRLNWARRYGLYFLRLFSERLHELCDLRLFFGGWVPGYLRNAPELCSVQAFGNAEVFPNEAFVVLFQDAWVGALFLAAFTQAKVG